MTSLSSPPQKLSKKNHSGHAAPTVSTELQEENHRRFLLGFQQMDLKKWHEMSVRDAHEKELLSIKSHKDAKHNRGPVHVLAQLYKGREKWIKAEQTRTGNFDSIPSVPSHIPHVPQIVKTWTSRIKLYPLLQNKIIVIGGYLEAAMLELNPTKQLIELTPPLFERSSVHSGQKFMRFLIANRRQFVLWL